MNQQFKNSIDDQTRIEQEIKNKNPWYFGSQFEWAEKPFIRPIFQKRFEFFSACIDRAQKRLGRPIRMLDAGCGDGYWLKRLSWIPDLTLTGVDYNPLRVERAREMNPGVTVIHQELSQLSENNKYHVILLNQVLEHVHDDVGLLMLLSNLLEPEGSLILGTPNESSWLQHPPWKKNVETDHVHFYTESELLQKIEQAGLTAHHRLREAFYPGNDRLFYWLLAKKWGFSLLEKATEFWPAHCSDYYFECRIK